MTRFDHATEARALLIQGDAFTSSDMVLQTGETKADVIAQAQVHATLALVEQQRIANLIALAKVAGRDEDVHESVAEAAYGALDVLVDTTALRPDIAAALGIEGAS